MGGGGRLLKRFSEFSQCMSSFVKIKTEKSLFVSIFSVAENSFDSNKYNLDWALKKTIEMFQRNFQNVE